MFVCLFLFFVFLVRFLVVLLVFCCFASLSLSLSLSSLSLSLSLSLSPSLSFSLYLSRQICFLKLLSLVTCYNDYMCKYSFKTIAYRATTQKKRITKTLIICSSQIMLLKLINCSTLVVKRFYWPLNPITYKLIEIKTIFSG